MSKYVIVTTISTTRIKYCIPVDEIRRVDPTCDIAGLECEWAEDSVDGEEVGDFSRKDLGESIIESQIVSEKEMLRQFDEDNEYYSASWSKKQKIKNVMRNWSV